jgi:hypothetical protein
MRLKFYLALILILMSLIWSNLAYAGNLTGSWYGTVSGDGKNAYLNSSAGNIDINGVISTTGNAR